MGYNAVVDKMLKVLAMTPSQATATVMMVSPDVVVDTMIPAHLITMATVSRAARSGLRIVRKTISTTYPGAYIQHLCLSLPGSIIKTTKARSYLSGPTGITTNQRNAIIYDKAISDHSMMALDNRTYRPRHYHGPHRTPRGRARRHWNNAQTVTSWRRLRTSTSKL
ncbi:hypothetical protein FVEN_g11748 [Fusarium venenatum]|nr:hypothetical protein FVEN_g11748 [Fusarium venenatum]